MQVCEEHQLLTRLVEAKRESYRPQAPTYCIFHQEYERNTIDCQKLDRDLE